MAVMESTMSTASVKRAKGGAFLIEEFEPGDIFTPEDLSDEHRQIAKTATDFARNEVMPSSRRNRGQEFRRHQGLSTESRRSWLDERGHSRSLWRHGIGQGHLRTNRGIDQQAGQFLDVVQRPRRHRYAAHRVVWHGGAKAEVPSETRHGRVDRGLRAYRNPPRLPTP